MTEPPRSGVRLLPAGLGNSSVRLVEPGVRIREVAMASRDAAIEFLSGGHRWGRRDLAAWLTGPYRNATAGLKSVERNPSHGPPPSLEDRALRDVIRRARRDAMLFVQDVLASGATDTLTQYVEHGLVAPACDESLELGFVAVDVARSRLSDRVTSLIAALCLTYPAEYIETDPEENELFCAAFGGLEAGAAAG